VRNIVFAAIAMSLGLLVPLGMAEVVLRSLPVSEGLRALPVNEANPVFHFTPNRDVTWSHGWSFDIVNRLHVNNAGYVNDQSYDIDDARPLLAVVGDSYVEAAMVPYAETLQGRLAAIASPNRRVYSFAASGAPLSQYLVWAREARATWKAQALVVVVVGNDFDESLAMYKTGPGFHHYVEAADGSLTLTRFDLDPKTQDRLQQLMQASYNDDYVGNTMATASRERVDKSKSAIDAFLADMKTYAGWPAEKVVFVVDGVRYPADAARRAGSYFGQMRSYFMTQAQHAGFETIDMDLWFFTHARLTPAARFEFPDDNHWNRTAHGLAAAAVARSLAFTHWRQGGSAETSN
jgi:hypothetical protein